MPLAPLIGLGLSVLPKIPELWSEVASLFGKEPPKVVADAEKLANEITESFTKGKVPPDVQVKLEQIFANKQIRLKEIALEETKLQYQEMSEQKDLQKVEAQSEDPYVRQTRPKILRRLFGLVAIYYLGTTAAALYLNPSKEILALIKEFAYYLTMLFGVGFVGYTASRSIFDKAGFSLPGKLRVVSKLITGG